MNITIIIPTKDRPEELQRCLQSIAAQTVACSQVIVVDASAQPQPQLETVWHNKISLRYIHSSPGITKQRNIALTYVAPNTECVVFIDDDVELAINTLSAVTHFFQQQPKAIGVTGTILGEVAATWGKKLFGAFTLLYASQPFGITAGVFNSINPAQRIQSVQWLPGAFMAYRWPGIARLQFDEWFAGYGLGEDLDFSLRAQAYGKVYVDPAITVTHHHSSKNRNWKLFGYMRVVNRYYIYTKHFFTLSYGVGYYWATSWLLIINSVRALYSRRYRAEWLGNWQGIQVLLHHRILLNKNYELPQNN